MLLHRPCPHQNRALFIIDGQQTLLSDPSHVMTRKHTPSPVLPITNNKLNNRHWAWRACPHQLLYVKDRSICFRISKKEVVGRLISEIKLDETSVILTTQVSPGESVNWKLSFTFYIHLNLILASKFQTISLPGSGVLSWPGKYFCWWSWSWTLTSDWCASYLPRFEVFLSRTNIIRW